MLRHFNCSAVVAVLALSLVGCGGNDSNSLSLDLFNPKITYDSLTDSRDGKTYRTVSMPDGKMWMAENLNYDTLSGTGSWCYDNKPVNCATYGRLYTWAAAMGIGSRYNNNTWYGSSADHQGVCPAGWRVPNSTDWDSLIIALGGSGAGRKLKSLSGWSNNGNGTDEYGFSALPGGNRWYDGNFRNVGYNGYYWSATEDVATNARYRNINYNYDNVYDNWGFDKYSALSLRCVRN